MTPSLGTFNSLTYRSFVNREFWPDPLITMTRHMDMAKLIARRAGCDIRRTARRSPP